MKRIMCLILALITTLVLFGCKSRNNRQGSDFLNSNTAMQTIQDSDVNKDTQSTDNSVADNETNDTEDTVADDSQTENPNGITSDTDTAVDELTDEPKSYEGILAVDRLNKLGYFLTDIFVGKVIDVKQLNDPKDTPNVFFEEDTNNKIYTVVVEETIWSLCLTKGTTITVIHTDNESFEKELWSKSYEIGKSYLIGGIIQPYDNTTVIMDVNAISSELKQNDELVPICKGADVLLSDVKSIDGFVSHPEIKTVLQSEPNIPPIYLKAYDIDFNDDAENVKKNQLIADLKKAIIADSDFKMELKPTEAAK